MGYIELQNTPDLVNENKDYKYNVVNIIATGSSILDYKEDKEWEYINNSRVNIGVNKLYHYYIDNWVKNKNKLDITKLNYLCFYDISFLAMMLKEKWCNIKYPFEFVTLKETIEVSELRCPDINFTKTVNKYHRYFVSRLVPFVKYNSDLYKKGYIGYKETMTTSYLAFNFAVFIANILKVDTINIFGLDLYGLGLNNYEYRRGRFGTWQRHFEELKDYLSILNIKVVNRNIKSNLDCFYKQEL